MKKVSVILILLSLTIVGFSQTELKVYGGIQFGGVSTTDFENFDISDWQKYGLLSENPGSAEGRVRVPLADNDVSGLKLGIALGAEYNLSEKLNALGEIQYTINSNVKNMAIYAGINYTLLSKDKFKLGLVPKIGYSSGEVNFGATTLITNYTPPVIITQGSFSNGDALKAKISGLGLQIGIAPEYKINDQYGIRAHLGYGLAFGGKSEMSVTTDSEEIVIDMTDAAIVKADGSGTQAGLNPTVKSKGINFQIGVTYNLSF